MVTVHLGVQLLLIDTKLWQLGDIVTVHVQALKKASLMSAQKIRLETAVSTNIYLQFAQAFAYKDCGVPNCETESNSTKIVGGTESCTGQYPWQVQINTIQVFSPPQFHFRLLFYSMVKLQEVRVVEEL